MIRKYTVQDAVTAARIRLKAEGVTTICIDTIKNKSMHTPITLKELNDISDELYLDTLRWED